MRISREGITYDDVLLIPSYSEIMPAEANTKTKLTKQISLNIPLVSSPMDTVTESQMAIALAKIGGMGIIHKNMTVYQQQQEVRKVKRNANGVITDPVTLESSESIATAKDMMDQNDISGIPIVDQGELVGIITKRDLRFIGVHDSTQKHECPSIKISEVMTGRLGGNLVTITQDELPVKSLLDEGDNDTGREALTYAEQVLTSHKVEKLLIIDQNYQNGSKKLIGMVTIKDIDLVKQYPDAVRDRKGRLVVGAAIGVYDYDRADRLVDESVDVLVVDSAHGHTKNVIDTVKCLKQKYGDRVQVIAGNVATSAAALDLINAGVDAVKVGIGPGSICTTRVVSGVGVPQITAIMDVADVCDEHEVPLIADGGIRFSGDITKALAAGADSVMIGSMFAGFNESPGEVIHHNGRAYKAYRGMGSLGAMAKGSSERYRQAGADKGKKLVPEGVEGRVPYKGELNQFVGQLVGGLQAGMGYCGAETLMKLKTAEFIKISSASMNESHPHGINITKEAPNYSPGV
ncbi:IMP dehydrogenase [bacterium]|nr:IMP dehydrogenase [bacterium]